MSDRPRSSPEPSDSGTYRRRSVLAGFVAVLGTIAGCTAPPGVPGERQRTPGGQQGTRGPMGPGGQQSPMGPGGQQSPRGPGGTRGTPQFGRAGGPAGWFADVDNFRGVEDRTGQATVTVRVGADGNGGDFAFEPPAIRVTRGTTVVWRWTGLGGAHDVAALDGSFRSRLTADAGFAFEHPFDRVGRFHYYCTPHRSLGMKGVVSVA
ncbi:halocyanin domain-containing protein [Halobacteriaceae archaeon GCM10025711]